MYLEGREGEGDRRSGGKGGCGWDILSERRLNEKKKEKNLNPER